MSYLPHSRGPLPLLVLLDPTFSSCFLPNGRPHDICTPLLRGASLEAVSHYVHFPRLPVLICCRCHTNGMSPLLAGREAPPGRRVHRLLFEFSAVFVVYIGQILCRHKHHRITYALCLSVCNTQTW